MPVIINDFDVVVDPPQEAPRDATPAERPVAEPPRSPLDLADLLDRQHERRLRLRAH